MTHEEYDSVINSKVPSAWNFHNVLTAMQAPLDFFIAISFAAGVVGNRGQAAYAAANTFLDAFVQYRLHLGLPAAAIDLTAVSDVGYLAENAERKAAVAENLGSDTINEGEVLALLAAAITGKMLATCNAHCITGMRIPPQPAPAPFWAQDAKFKHLFLAAETASAQDPTTLTQKVISLNAQLKSASTVEEAESVVCKGLIDKVATVLMLERDEMDVSKSISSYGLDSLVAIEIRNFITREFEANLQVLELLTSASITALATTICGRSKLVRFGGDVEVGE